MKIIEARVSGEELQKNADYIKKIEKEAEKVKKKEERIKQLYANVEKLFKDLHPYVQIDTNISTLLEYDYTIQVYTDPVNGIRVKITPRKQ